MKTDKKSEKNIAGMISINIGQDAAANAVKNLDTERVMVLPTRNLVLFPGVALPIQLGRESSIKAAEYARKTNQPLAVFCQKESETEHPSLSELYATGTLVRIIDIIELPDGIKTVIVEGLKKIRIVGKSESPKFDNVLEVKIDFLQYRDTDENSQSFMAVTEKIRETVKKLTRMAPDEVSPLQLPQIDKIKDPGEFIKNITVHGPLDVEEKQEVLECASLEQSATVLLKALMKREEKMEIMQDILGKTRARMEEGQRNAFLQQQLDVLRTELEGDEDEIDELEARAQQAGLPEQVMERFSKEMRKMRRYNPQSPDYAVQFTYLDTLLSLPWQDATVCDNTFAKAEKILERDHYGLRKIKDRILEQIALIMNNPDGQAPIICFVGPPGVGKTSLGQSIAEALGREFQRVSLGGLHDEAEIRGHRRTYIGAMPGRIIEAMRRATTVNPVIMLDELDKIGNDFKGDPAAALLEVLDPAQNYRFHDNYIDVDYDLSSVLFIATANTLSTISKPLLDRIEVIELSGYTVEEKVEIAVRHIIPKLREKNAIDESVVVFERPVVKKVIEEYTSESGVRQLEKKLEALMRKKLLVRMRSHKNFVPEVLPSDLQDLLGAPIYIRDKYEGNSLPGVVTGLAWTSVGGEILLVESALSAGKGNLVLTGNLGDVMKESATLALEWIKVNAEKLGIDSDVFKNNDFHVHFPEGAVPKDGPSAGITIVTALTSAITGRLLNPAIAMTGEITLRGKVLPVGGIKEKVLAAKRGGIKHIIISKDNKKDIDDIEKQYLKGLKFSYVGTITEVLDIALEKEGLKH